MNTRFRQALRASLSACLLAAACFGAIRPASAQYSATVSGTNLQTVKGWGCHAYDKPVSATVTQAFCVDLGMTVDRIYLGSDVGSDDQGNINSAVFDPICSAIGSFNSHGIKYILCSWSPNPGMKTPAINTTADLRTDHEGQFANYFVNLCRYLQNKGLPLPIAISVQNEPTTTADYDNMHFVNENNFDYSQYYRVIKDLRAKLDTNGFSSVKLLGPEDGSYDTGNNWGCSLAFLGGNGFSALNDSALNNAIWGVSSHSYNWGGGVGYLQQWAGSAEQWGKDKWMTEYSYIENGETNTVPIDVAVWGTRRLISDMVCVRNNYWLWWDGYSPGIPVNEVLMADDGVTKYPMFYVLSRIFKSAPVGSVVRRVTSTDPNMVTNDDIWMDGMAFVSGGSTTVVLVNFSGTDRTTSVNGLTGTSAQVYQTAYSQNDVLIGSPSVTNGTISSVKMAAWSVTVIKTSGGANWDPNAYYSLICHTSGQAADTNNSSTSGSPVVQNPTQPTWWIQQWQIVSAGGGYYNLVCHNSGKALDCNGSTTSGSTVVQKDSHSSYWDQQWLLQSAGGGYYNIINHTSGKSLDCNGSTANGTNLVQKDSHSTYWDQQWQIVKD